MDYLINVGLSIARSLPWIAAIWLVYFLAKYSANKMKLESKDSVQVEKIVRVICCVCTVFILIGSILYTPFTYKNNGRDTSREYLQEQMLQERMESRTRSEITTIPATRESQEEREQRTKEMLQY